MKLKDCQILVKQGILCKFILDKTGKQLIHPVEVCEKCTPEKKEKALKAILNSQELENKEFEFYRNMSIVDMSKNFARAMARATRSKFKKVDENEFIERQVCCSTCKGEKRCPYCGCYFDFKARLKSETGCPNPETYKRLKRYPPRDYWAVCNEITSVIIPARNELYLNRTIENLIENATGKIEIIVILDGYEYEVIKRDSIEIINHPKPLGRRVSINEAARIAKGKYLFIVDAHCTMSEGWDTKLKCACDEKSIAVAVIKPLTLKWELEEANYGFVELNDSLVEKWVEGKGIKKCKIIEPMMAFTGCAWMIQKDYYWKLEGYNEELGEYGYDGPEWALKVWLNEKYPGSVLLRTDVFCGHLFGTNTDNVCYPTKLINHDIYYEKMIKKWGDALSKLFDKFKKVKITTDEKIIYETIVKKVDEIIKKDLKGKIIQHVKIHYKPYQVKHDGTKTEDEITKEVVALINEVEREEKIV